MDTKEFIKGFELSIASKLESLSLEDARLLKMFLEHLKAAANYRMGSEYLPPQPPRPAPIVPEFPKPLAKYANDKVIALYFAPSLDSQATETHSAPWFPLRSLAEYEELKAAGIPEVDPREGMSERERRLEQQRRRQGA